MTVLAWQRAGSPGGPAVALLHAWAADGARDWEATGWVEHLAAAGLDVLVPDLPGHGGSADVLLPPEAEPAGWTASLLMHDLAMLGAGPVQSVGYAEGCLVASHLAVRAAAADRTVASDAGPTSGLAPTSGPGPTSDAAPRAPGSAAAREVRSLVLIGADDRDGVAYRDEIAAGLRDTASRVWHAEAAEAVAKARADRRHHLPTLAMWVERAAWPAAPRLGALRIPALLGVGADDERRDHLPRLAQLFHNARLVTVPGDRRTLLGAGELVTTVSRFLAEHAEAS